MAANQIRTMTTNNEIFTITKSGKLQLHLHFGQTKTWDSKRRIILMSAGAQGGKTALGGWWIWREICQQGSGDYLAITTSFDLFQMKMLPEMLKIFEEVLGIGRYWAGTRTIEIRNPETNQFMAERSSDQMWARVILRSAISLSGLEAATAKAAWLDEAGQDEFTIEAWRAIRRRLALYRGRILITTTLYNLGWLKQQVLDVAEKGGNIAEFNIGKGQVRTVDNEKANIGVIQFDSIINPKFPYEEYKEAEETLPKDLFLMFYRGRVAMLRDLIYDCFDTSRHLCKRFDIPLTWPRYLGLDFGGVHMAGVFFAEDPNTHILYCYREYLEGRMTTEEHVMALKKDEPRFALVIGGSGSEQQWRDEFGDKGLYVRCPKISDVSVGISKVYKEIKKDGIIYFDDLDGIIDQKGRYRRVRDKRTGEIIDEIENKRIFHFLDAERYIISEIRGKPQPKAEDFEELGTVEDFELRWR